MLTIIIIGAGINGVVAAIELKRRGHRVTLLDPGPIPHPLAASTDISKAVRSCYGADEDYTQLAEEAIRRWRNLNASNGTTLYHEVGTMFLRQSPMKAGDFEYESLELLRRRSAPVERISPDEMRRRFPAWNAERFVDGVFNAEGGYVESGRVVAKLVGEAERLGVELRAGATFRRLDETDNGVTGVVLSNGERLPADRVVVATGAWTPFLLSFTAAYFRATGHPVFHFRPNDPALFASERFPMFGADISGTGFYGFPATAEGIVKIGRHGPGREMSPESTERIVTKEEEDEIRQFLSSAFPALATAPVVFTRICLYCDTADGDFWIAPDPERKGLIIAAGDSGHGFKFAPVLGELIADCVEEKSNPFLHKFRWRPEISAGQHKEAARFAPRK